MKNKKIIIILVVLVFSIGGIFLINNIYQNKNKINKTKRRKQNNLAIMIKEEGASGYTKSSSNDMPIGNYVLNEEKTHCENNGKILSYDNTTGKVKFSFVGSDRCYLYFDYEEHGIKFETLMIANNTDIFDENGLRYEGADPNNYICLDNKEEGSCSKSTLLFRIIGLFEEEYSNDGTTSSGSKKLLKIIDTNNFGLPSWDENGTNNWSSASLKIELNDDYLEALTSTSNVNSKLSNAIANAKWHLGGANDDNYNTLTAEGIYTEERNTNAIYSVNPSSIYARIGLMYPSDYGYATVGGSTTNKSSCRSLALCNWNYMYDDCKNNNWLFMSQSNFTNDGEWLISPYSSASDYAAALDSDGSISLSGLQSVDSFALATRPTFYLDSSVLKIVGGTGTSTDPYHIG